VETYCGDFSFSQLNSRILSLTELVHVSRSGTCVDTLSRKDKACANCSTPVDKKMPFIEVQREGSYGGVEVEKFGLAFQG
jgi:hypothetical protein